MSVMRSTTQSFNQPSDNMMPAVVAKRRPLGTLHVNTTTAPDKAKTTKKSTVIKSKPKNSSYLRKSTEQVRGAQAPKEQVTKTEPTSIFRQTYFSMDEGFQDMLTLKRANPVCDSSDEEEFESPTKRTRVFDEDNRDESAQERHAEPQILDWRDHQPEDEIEGFQLSRLLH